MQSVESHECVHGRAQPVAHLRAGSYFDASAAVECQHGSGANNGTYLIYLRLM